MPFTSHAKKLMAPLLSMPGKYTICARAAEHLLITIMPYTAMEEGDLIELFWDGRYVTSRQLKKPTSIALFY